MCCSNRCKYEGYQGDCTLRPGKPYPPDALCVRAEALAEQDREKEAEDTSANKICPWCKQPILPNDLTVTDSDGDELHLSCDIEIGEGQIIDNECGDR